MSAERFECLVCGAHVPGPGVSDGQGWYRIYCEVCGAERDSVAIRERGTAQQRRSPDSDD